MLLHKRAHAQAVAAYARLMNRKSEPLSDLKHKHAIQLVLRQHLGRQSRIRGCRPCRWRRTWLLRHERGRGVAKTRQERRHKTDHPDNEIYY